MYGFKSRSYAWKAFCHKNVKARRCAKKDLLLLTSFESSQHNLKTKFWHKNASFRPSYCLPDIGALLNKKIKNYDTLISRSSYTSNRNTLQKQNVHDNCAYSKNYPRINFPCIRPQWIFPFYTDATTCRNSRRVFVWISKSRISSSVHGSNSGNLRYPLFIRHTCTIRTVAAFSNCIKYILLSSCTCTRRFRDGGYNNNISYRACHLLLAGIQTDI